MSGLCFRDTVACLDDQLLWDIVNFLSLFISRVGKIWGSRCGLCTLCSWWWWWSRSWSGPRWWSVNLIISNTAANSDFMTRFSGTPMSTDLRIDSIEEIWFYLTQRLNLPTMTMRFLCSWWADTNSVVFFIVTCLAS